MRPSIPCLLWAGSLLLACDASQSVLPADDLPPVWTGAGDGLSRFVDVFVGTDDAPAVAHPVPNGAGGSTFPAAAAPFGLVQWGPDTVSATPPGYRYADDHIAAFSLTHLSGAGCPASRDFPVIPALGDVATASAAALPFHHDREVASPGFYEVQLQSGIQVDLTATVRSGLARFTFPPSTDALLILRNTMDGDLLVAQQADLQVLSPTLVTGSRLDSFCVSGTPTRIYMAARFDRPLTAEVFGEGESDPARSSQRHGGVALHIDTRTQRTVHMKVGLSAVSAQAALANLDAEIPGWDFDALHRKTLQTWDDYLGRVAVTGGDEASTRSLYSALYRVFLQPATWNDVDGAYFGFDQQVHAGDGHVHYAHFSGWDIYRSWVPLVALLAPQQTSDMMRSLILAAQQGGALPRWAYGASETGIMIGDPADVMIAASWAFGARDFDAAAALAWMRRGAEDVHARCNDVPARPGLAEYLDRHYCAVDGAEGLDGTTARTLEYAIADSAIARFAADQGDAGTAAQYQARAAYWRNVFDPSAAAGRYVGAMQPRRLADVGTAPDFVRSDVGSDRSVVEGSLEQYTFLVPQDVPGLIRALGGDALFIARLTDHLSQVNSGTQGTHLYIGNEPGFATPWLFPFAGAPEKTQEAVGRILDQAFALSPAGLPGNEDLGALASWQAWALMGLYPVVPGVGGLVISSPRFAQVSLRLPTGKTLRIVAQGRSSDSRHIQYIQDATWNGQPWSVPWLPASALQRGGDLSLSMASAPGRTWGVAPADRPQALIP